MPMPGFSTASKAQPVAAARQAGREEAQVSRSRSQNQPITDRTESPARPPLERAGGLHRIAQRISSASSCCSAARRARARLAALIRSPRCAARGWLLTSCPRTAPLPPARPLSRRGAQPRQRSVSSSLSAVCLRHGLRVAIRAAGSSSSSSVESSESRGCVSRRHAAAATGLVLGRGGLGGYPPVPAAVPPAPARRTSGWAFGVAVASPSTSAMIASRSELVRIGTSFSILVSSEFMVSSFLSISFVGLPSLPPARGRHLRTAERPPRWMR